MSCDPIVTFDAWNRVHVEGIDHCPWCGEPDTGGEFCDAQCLREYWADIRGIASPAKPDLGSAPVASDEAVPPPARGRGHFSSPLILSAGGSTHG